VTRLRGSQEECYNTPTRMGVTGGGADYEWDLFVSYKHDEAGHRLMTPWVERLLEHVRFWLRQALGGVPARVFFDTEAIEVGTGWPDELRHGIRHSRCLLPILSPEYFQSRWCLAEWTSFVARRRLLPARANHVILPVKFCDGVWFPREAHEIQHLDLSEHASLMPGFWSSPDARPLEQKIKPFAERLAEAIHSAPPFQAWPLETPDPMPPARNVKLLRL
jgi:TIR domain